MWSWSSFLEDVLERGTCSDIGTRLMALDKILAIFRGPILYKISLGGTSVVVRQLTVDV